MKEIFVPTRRNSNGRRYGFVRFKGVNDTHLLAKQLDRIIIGGLKLYVNIPRYDRETTRKGVVERKVTNQADRVLNIVDRTPKQAHSNPGSYVEALKRNIRILGHGTHQNNRGQRYETSKSSVTLDIAPEDHNWVKDAWVGRLKNPAMFGRLEDEILWET